MRAAKPDGSYALGNFSYDTMCRESCAFLPSNDLAQIVSREENIPVGLMQLLVRWLCAFKMGIRKTAKTVRNRWPRNVDRLRKLLAMPGVKLFHGSPGRLQLRSHGSEPPERGRRTGLVNLDVISRKQ